MVDTRDKGETEGPPAEIGVRQLVEELDEQGGTAPCLSLPLCSWVRAILLYLCRMKHRRGINSVKSGQNNQTTFKNRRQRCKMKKCNNYNDILVHQNHKEKKVQIYTIAKRGLLHCTFLGSRFGLNFRLRSGVNFLL